MTPFQKQSNPFKSTLEQDLSLGITCAVIVIAILEMSGPSF